MTDRTEVPPTPVKDIPEGATFRLARTGDDLIMGGWSYEPFELRIAVDYRNALTGHPVRMIMSAQTHGYVIAPPPEGMAIAIMPSGDPFTFEPGGQVYAIDSWRYTQTAGLMEFDLCERVPGTGAWKMAGRRQIDSDTIIYPVLEG